MEPSERKTGRDEARSANSEDRIGIRVEDETEESTETADNGSESMSLFKVSDEASRAAEPPRGDLMDATDDDTRDTARPASA